jgi:hypothetical protein
MNDLTTSYFNIEKSDKQPDGTLMVYGKATDDSMDIDQQICDAAWLDRAMPAWFKSGGNIREQHSSIAAGVAKEYEPKADGHYIMAHIVDPVSVKKVDAGVLRGFSIGIKSPRVVRDTKAANGRIIDGQIVEVSLVDRPANPNCQLVLAKSVDGESSLVQVEELSEIEKHGSHDQKTHGGGRGRGGGAGDSNSQIEAAKEDIDNRIAGAESQLNRTPAGRNVDTHQSHVKGTVDGYKATKTRIGNKKELKKLKTSADSSREQYVQNTDDSGMKSYAYWAGFSGAVNSIVEAYGDVEKASEADLEKHGSHDQKTHGGGRGRGGGAGGGGSAGAGRSNEKIKSEKTKVQDLNDKMRKHKASITSSSSIDEGTKADVEQQVSDAQGHITDGQKYLDNAQATKDMADHVDQVQRAAESFDEVNRILETGPTETLSQIGAAFKKTSKDLESYAKGIGSSKASHPALRKALQSALQLHSLNKSEETSMKDTVELPIEVVSDLLKFDAVQYEAARNALASLIEVEAGEMREGHNEIQSIGHLLQSVMHLTAWYEGEEAEGEVMEQEEVIERAAGSETKMKPAKDEKKPDFLKRCKDAGMEDDAATATWDKYMAAMADDAEKSAEISKCLECGCNQPGTTHGLTTTNDFANVEKPSHVTTAEMYAPGESPKSAEGEEPAVATEEEVKAEEPATEETPAVETTEVSADDKSADVEALVEQVVKSATESLKSEIAELVSAKEAALSKAMSLETELELAKSLAVAGGPSRTARPLNVKTTNDLLTKAAIYKAKANATTDPTLAKGYKSLAEEFLNKANEADNK